jgi:hypothetical protein
LNLAKGSLIFIESLEKMENRFVLAPFVLVSFVNGITACVGNDWVLEKASMQMGWMSGWH